MSVLTDLRIGETATLLALDLPESVQNYLMHMGFVPNARVTALRRAPAGDPTVYGVDGMQIALRHETAESIHIRMAGEETPGETDAQLADLDEIVTTSAQATQSEIHEFAGATR